MRIRYLVQRVYPMKFISCYDQESVIHNCQMTIETTQLNYRIIHQRPCRNIHYIIFLIEIAFLICIPFFYTFPFSFTIKVHVVFCLDIRI